MGPSSISHLISQSFSKTFLEDKTSASNSLADHNQEEVKDVIPENLRVPTGEEIREFKTWEMQFRTKHPKASDREVRRAVLKHFKIMVVQGQNMISK